MGANSRRGSILPWTLAVVLTLAAALYQYLEGPTRPIFGRAELGASHLRYKLERTTAAAGDYEIRLKQIPTEVQGTVAFRRYPGAEPWTVGPMERQGDLLVGRLPHQPPAGKVAYQVFLQAAPGGGQAASGSNQAAAAQSQGAAPAEARMVARLEEARPEGSVVLPPGGPIVIRYRGDVPWWILIPHIWFMFVGMLWSNRAGIEALRPKGNPLRLGLRSLGLLFVGGLIFGPLVQRYSFGQLWTGFPFGFDLTDNKTLITVVVWVAALLIGSRLARGAAGRNSAGGAAPAPDWSLPWVRRAILAAALVTLVVFSIPHSVMGTELQQGKPVAGAPGR